jgi:hypothetical protein
MTRFSLNYLGLVKFWLAAPRRKRPRLRTKPCLMGPVAEAGLPASSSDTAKSCGKIVPACRIETGLILPSCLAYTESSSVNAEAGLLHAAFTSGLVSASASPLISPETHIVGLTSPAGLLINVAFEQKNVALDKEAKKVEINTKPLPLHSGYSVDQDRRPAFSDVARVSATFARETGEACKISGDEPLAMELDERYRRTYLVGVDVSLCNFSSSYPAKSKLLLAAVGNDNLFTFSCSPTQQLSRAQDSTGRSQHQTCGFDLMVCHCSSKF